MMWRQTPALAADSGRPSSWTWAGIGVALLLYLALAVCAAMTLPWRGSLDSMSHMDYVYQVHHGRLPEPFGTQYRKVEPRKAEDPNRPKTHHLTASHPPLFYFIASFPMGRLLDVGHWQQAVWRGRLLNIGIGLSCLLALAWAGWRLGGASRERLAIALPAVVGTSAIFVRLSADIYNDLLVALLSILVITLSCLLVREGVRRRYLVALVVLGALGMATKATFIFALVIAIGATFLAVYWDGDHSEGRRLLRAAGKSALMSAIMILPSFGFYLGNYRLSGSWFLASPKMQVQSRVEFTAVDVLTNEKYWLLMPSGLLGGKWGSNWNQWSLWLSALCALGLLYLVISRGAWRHLLHLDRIALVWMLPVVHFAGLMFAQFHHKVGWGALNFRYLIPALLTIGLFLAIPAVAWRRFSGIFVGAICAIMAAAAPAGAMAYLDLRYPQIARGQSSWDRLLEAAELNGFSVNWIYAGGCMAVAAIVLLVIALPKARVAASADRHDSLSVGPRRIAT